MTKSATSVIFTTKILNGKLHFFVQCLVGHLNINPDLCLNESIATYSNESIATVANVFSMDFQVLISTLMIISRSHCL